MPYYEQLPPPEEADFGLHASPEGDYVLHLPTADQASTAINFASRSLYHILRSDATVGDNKIQRVLLAGLDYAGGQIVTVAAGELLDVSLAETMRAMGDVGLRAAMSALHDARDEPSEAGKMRHRHTAEAHIRFSYAGYEEGINVYERNVLDRAGLMPREGKVALLERATTSALFVSSINRTAGLKTAANTWARNARERYNAYEEQARKRSKNGKDLTDLGVVFGALRSLSTFGLDNNIIETAVGRAEKHKKILDELPQERANFDRLYDLLMTST